MRSRDIFLTGTAAGVVVGGLTWFIMRKRAEVGEVAPVHVGELFPRVTGTTLSGERLTVPDDLLGRVAVLILADNYGARFEADEWADLVRARFGERDDLAVLQIPVIGGVGPVMQRMIDAAMVRGTPSTLHRHVLTLYGDLQTFRKQLGMTGRPQAHVVVLGRTGRIAWMAQGSPTDERRAEIETILSDHGVEGIAG